MQRLKSQLQQQVRQLQAENIQLRKHNEHLENLAKQYKESSRLLDEIVQHLPGMSYQCLNDADWTMVYVNEGCYELTGYKPVDIVGNWSTSYSRLIHPEDRDRVWYQVQRSLADKRSFRMSYRIVTDQGQIKYVWEIGIGIYDENGKLQKIQGFISDVPIDW